MNYERYYGRAGSCVICKKIKVKRTYNPRVYRFPIEPDRCREWVKYVGIESLAYLSHQNLNNHKFLCEIHFSPLSFNSKRGLHNMAIPSQNLPYEPLSDKLLIGFPVKKMKRRKGSHTEKSSTSTNMNVGTSSDADIPIMNCTETVMNKEDSGEPKDTLNDKETSNIVTSNVTSNIVTSNVTSNIVTSNVTSNIVTSNVTSNIVTSNVKHVKGEQKKTEFAVPTPLKKCIKTKGSSGGKIRILPQTLISKSKRYGKCYSRANKIMKQNNTTELTNDNNILQLPSAEVEIIFEEPIMDKEPSKEDVHDVPLKADELPDPNKTDELPDPNKTDELPDPNKKYDDILPPLPPKPGTTYDTPLMNCTDTIFKYGKIHHGTVTSGDYEVITINVPLMQCLKTIEDII